MHAVTKGHGDLLHWNGQRWFRAGGFRFHMVEGTGPKRAFAIGPYHFCRWDGTDWLEEMPASMGINYLWVAGPDDVWASGTLGEVMRWREGQWDGPKMLPCQNDLWGANDSNLFIAADEGLLVRVEGDDLDLIFTDSHDALRSVWGRGSNDVWAVGDRGAVVHWDGSSAALTRVGSANLVKVLGGPSGEPWVLAENGSLLRRSGPSFVPVPVPGGMKVHKLAAGRAGPLAFAGDEVGATTLLQFTNAGVRERSLRETDARVAKSISRGDPSDPIRISSLWVNSEDDFWLAGELHSVVGIGHWNGRALDRLLDVKALTSSEREGNSPSAELEASMEGALPDIELTAVGGADDLWAAVDGVSFRFDGSTWREQAWAPIHPYAVWKGEERLWIVGHQGIAWRPRADRPSP